MTTLKINTDELDQHKLKKAIAALRCGKYEQHKGSMVSHTDRSKACCLMVIAQEVDGMPWEGAITPTFASFLLPSACKMPNESRPSFATTCQSLKAVDESGFTYGLAELNDEILTHPQIAELLETGEMTI